MKVAMWLIIVSIITFLLLMLFLYIQFHIEYREKRRHISFDNDWEKFKIKRIHFILFILISLMPIINAGLLIGLSIEIFSEDYEVRCTSSNRITKIIKWLDTEINKD